MSIDWKLRSLTEEMVRSRQADIPALIEAAERELDAEERRHSAAIHEIKNRIAQIRAVCLHDWNHYPSLASSEGMSWCDICGLGRRGRPS